MGLDQETKSTCGWQNVTQWNAESQGAVMYAPEREDILRATISVGVASQPASHESAHASLFSGSRRMACGLTVELDAPLRHSQHELTVWSSSASRLTTSRFYLPSTRTLSAAQQEPD